jgi:hypothetical protein
MDQDVGSTPARVETTLTCLCAQSAPLVGGTSMLKILCHDFMTSDFMARHFTWRIL